MPLHKISDRSLGLVGKRGADFNRNAPFPLEHYQAGPTSGPPELAELSSVTTPDQFAKGFTVW